MSKIKISNFIVSLDGFGAGADQGMKEPLGIGAKQTHTWIFPTKRFCAMCGKNDGTEGIDNDFVEKVFENRVRIGSATFTEQKLSFLINKQNS